MPWSLIVSYSQTWTHDASLLLIYIYIYIKYKLYNVKSFILNVQISTFVRFERGN